MFQGIFKSAINDANKNYIFGTGSIPINIKSAQLATFADGTTKQQGYQVAEVNKLISTMLTGWDANGNKPKSMSDNYLELILSCDNGFVVKKKLQFPHIIAWRDGSTKYNIANIYKEFSIDNWLKADDFENPDITLVVEPTDEILTTSTATPPEVTTTNSGRFYLYYRNLPIGVNRIHIDFHIKTRTEPIDFDLEVVDGLSWKDAQIILASNKQAKINVLLSTTKDIYKYTGAEGNFENITMHEWSALYQQIISLKPNNKFTHDLYFYIYDESELLGVLDEFQREIHHQLIYTNPQMFDENSEDVVKNKYIETIQDGEVVWMDFNNINESGYVKVTPGTKVYKTDFDTTGNVIKTDWGYLKVCYFDENRTPTEINGNPSTLGYIDIPSGVSYMRFCYNSPNKIVISEGANVTQYYDYLTPDYALKNRIEDVNRNLQEQIDKSKYAIEDINQRIADITGDGSQWINKTWYAYGTSITSVAQGKYVPYLAAMSQMNVVNKGIPGGGIGDLGGYSHGQVRTAIMNTTDGKLNADLITLEVGANDTSADVPLGTIYDTDETTLCGCLNMCIRYLQQNTNAQIVIMPSPATTTIPNADEKYYEAMLLFKQICFINKCWWIDGMTNLGTAKIQRTDISYVQDNIHQTELGGYVFAKAIWAELKKIPTFDITLPDITL